MSNTASRLEELNNLQCAANAANSSAVERCQALIEYRQEYARTALKSDISNQDYNRLVDLINYCDNLILQCLGIDRTSLTYR